MTRWRWWPRTLFARLALILFAGLALAYALSYTVIVYERGQASMALMMGYMERDVASSVALLDRLPAAERAEWLPRLERRSYRFLLEGAAPGVPPDALLSAQVAASIEQAIGTRYQLSASAAPDQHVRVHLRLRDGQPLTIDLYSKAMPLSPWLIPVLLLQLALLAVFSWFGVRLATRPLDELARAADALGPDLAPKLLAEDGPAEVARAAVAFNAMQQRIAAYMAERMQILAAISHDLQTPITRMRLRADLLDDEAQRDAMLRNLHEMEQLVREGVSYARSLHGAAEAARQLHPDALFDSLVCDYTDTGAAVTLHGAVGRTMALRPLALRRILTNLIDNALKFGGGAELHVQLGGDGVLTLSVRDRGPGIAPDQLEAVFQPFYRLETSRNRGTGGTGLGLAIARQLAQALDGELALFNRAGGGLEARLTLDVKSSSDPGQP